MKTTVTQIRRLRESRGWSVFQLSQKSGVQGQTIRNWEAGCQPSIGKLRLVARAFDVSIEELLDAHESVAV